MGATLDPVFVDAHLVAADKPAGLLAVPGRGLDKQDCLWSRLRDRFPDVLVVHRLDMATSGLMLFARGAAAQRALGLGFASREVEKDYVAVVAGRIDGEAGVIDRPVGADWPNRPRQQVDRANGRPATTRWQVLGRGDGATRLLLQPLTGRTHQLRVHLAAVGHPIVGDALYAPPEVAERSDRLLLHASGLRLRHPASGEPLVLSSPVPF